MARHHQRHISGWPAILLAPFAIPIALLVALAVRAGLLKGTADLTAEDVESYLEDFLDGESGDWDWDDFSSIPITDPELDRIREEALHMGLPLGEAERLRLVDLLAHVRTLTP